MLYKNLYITYNGDDTSIIVKKYSTGSILEFGIMSSDMTFVFPPEVNISIKINDELVVGKVLTPTGKVGFSLSDENFTKLGTGSFTFSANLQDSSGKNIYTVTGGTLVINKSTFIINEG